MEKLEDNWCDTYRLEKKFNMIHKILNQIKEYNTLCIVLQLHDGTRFVKSKY